MLTNLLFSEKKNNNKIQSNSQLELAPSRPPLSLQYTVHTVILQTGSLPVMGRRCASRLLSSPFLPKYPVCAYFKFLAFALGINQW